jgi:hypothetical protein
MHQRSMKRMRSLIFFDVAMSRKMPGRNSRNRR